MNYDPWYSFDYACLAIVACVIALFLLCAAIDVWNYSYRKRVVRKYREHPRYRKR